MECCFQTIPIPEKKLKAEKKSLKFIHSLILRSTQTNKTNAGKANRHVKIAKSQIKIDCYLKKFCLLFHGNGTHFGIILNFWLGAARTQRNDSTILKCECNHLGTFTARQQTFSIFLTCINSSCQISYR